MRNHALVCALAGIAVAAAGCGSTPGGSGGGGDDTSASTQAAKGTFDPASAGDRTLSVWTAESGERLKLVKQLGASFSKKYPNIKIKWVVRDFGSYPAQIKLALSSK